MTHDFNTLERRAKELSELGRFEDAIGIYLFMADGDPSLDAGYLGMKIGGCYEKLGNLHAAKYWYGRAVEENPDISAYREARERLMHLDIESLLA